MMHLMRLYRLLWVLVLRLPWLRLQQLLCTAVVLDAAPHYLNLVLQLLYLQQPQHFHFSIGR